MKYYLAQSCSLLGLAYTGITSSSSVAETNRSSVEDLAQEVECEKSCLPPKEMGQVPATPHMTKAGQDSLPGIKLQVAPLPR